MSGVSGVKESAYTDLSGGSWLDALKRTGKAFMADKLTVWAAALTYFGSCRSSPRYWRWCRSWA